MEMLQSHEFWLGLLKIIGVNIILSGDNAVVIALAARSLPPKQQKQAVFWGAGAAIGGGRVGGRGGLRAGSQAMRGRAQPRRRGGRGGRGLCGGARKVVGKQEARRKHSQPARLAAEFLTAVNEEKEHPSDPRSAR